MTESPGSPGSPEEPAPGELRRLPPLQRPKTLGGLLYFGVLAITLVGLAIVAFADWRRGTVVIGAGLLLSAVARVLLGEFDAGMLRVRRRWFDVLALVLVGGVLIFLAVTIPDQPRL
ncbi:hypothetical protein GCM10011519_32250 [Marmoricola endophyticus]|uniref:DUF3017 domain-containing protein n=1 Tax=Marmoricola endophyticus TaxID=2040280 RepID=A0A917F9P1_9ACTN|nr:DUF3017 domain-containing protein [Marmoricola endophyticus]GGF55863.1 hypothetical protein GCM10011519_32250 [Marmoricola endophyticus]